jgi:hypothetical protein
MNTYKCSKKIKNEDKYIDYAFNEFNCSLYKLVGKIKKAYDVLSR